MSNDLAVISRPREFIQFGPARNLGKVPQKAHKEKHPQRFSFSILRANIIRGCKNIFPRLAGAATKEAEIENIPS